MQWEVINSLSWVPAVLSLAGAAISLGTYYGNRHRILVQQTFEFLNEWREPELFEAATYIRSDAYHKKLTRSVVEQGLSGLSTDDLRQFRRVSHFMDYLGHAVQAEVLNEDLLFSTIAGSIEGLWKIMGPVIRAERDIRGQSATEADRAWYYQSDFEHVAEKSRLHRESAKPLEAVAYRGQLYEYPAN